MNFEQQIEHLKKYRENLIRRRDDGDSSVNYQEILCLDKTINQFEKILKDTKERFE